MPNKEELIQFTSIKEASEHYQKHPRTIRRWLSHYGLTQGKYSPGKIDRRKASEIRRLESEHTQQEIAEMYSISQTMVGRILNGLAHNIMAITGSAEVKFTPNEP